MPTLKGTEESLSYVQCFLYLVFSSMSLFFILHGWTPPGKTSHMLKIVKGKSVTHKILVEREVND